MVRRSLTATDPGRTLMGCGPLTCATSAARWTWVNRLTMSLLSTEFSPRFSPGSLAGPGTGRPQRSLDLQRFAGLGFPQRQGKTDDRRTDHHSCARILRRGRPAARGRRPGLLRRPRTLPPVVGALRPLAGRASPQERNVRDHHDDDDRAEGPANRTCGNRQLCCRLLPVRELAKGANVRCQHQKFGVGCAVYHRRRPFPAVALRPGRCRRPASSGTAAGSSTPTAPTFGARPTRTTSSTWSRTSSPRRRPPDRRADQDCSRPGLVRPSSTPTPTATPRSGPTSRRKPKAGRWRSSATTPGTAPLVAPVLSGHGRVEWRSRAASKPRHSMEEMFDLGKVKHVEA